MPPAARSSWLLIGRNAELEQISVARSEGRAAAVVVTGSAGVGKTRLAREALAVAERSGALTLWVQATRSAAIVPLGAFAGVLPVQIRSDDPFARLQGSVEALRDQAAGRALVIGVDDAQLLDPMSAALVLHLASTATAFIVATVRSGEEPPDAIAALWKDAGAPRLELGLLGEAEVGELLEDLLGGPADRETHAWAYRTSGGNVLYLCEMLIGARAEGALDQVNGRWRLRSAPTVSASLVDLVQARLSGVSEQELRILELLALGEPLRLAECEMLSGTEPLTTLEARGLAAIEGVNRESSVRLTHPLYGEVLRAGLPALRARELRLALADTVAARASRSPEDTLRLVRWMLDAGATIPTDRLMDGAAAACSAGDPHLDEDLAAQAREAGGGVQATLLLARALIIQRRFDEVRDVLASAEAEIETPEQALDYLEAQSEVLHWGVAKPADLHELLERAADWWPGEQWSEALAPLHGRLTSFMHLGGTTADRLESAPAFPLTEAEALSPVQVANIFYAGRTVEARVLALRIRPRPPLRTLDEAIALSLWSRITQETGEDWAGQQAWMTAALHEGTLARDHATAGQAAYSLAALTYHSGRYVDARGLLAEAHLQLERHDPVGLLAVADALEVVIACFSDDRMAIMPALERCHGRLGDTPALPHQFPYVTRAEAWAKWINGDRSGAREQLLEAAERMRSSPVHSARLTYEAMRAGVPAKKLAKKLDALSNDCDARLVAAYAVHARARASEDGAALLDVAATMETIGARRYAAEAAAHAADAYAKAGRADSARRAAAFRCRELTPADQEAQLPVMEFLKDPYANLTERELQLVEWARVGLSNADMAERLVLSVRTIESHLYRAMQKLGVSSRNEL